MKIEKIQNRLNMWKDIKDFPSFRELKQIAEKQKLNHIKFVLASNKNNFYILHIAFNDITIKNKVVIWKSILFAFNIDNNYIISTNDYYESLDRIHFTSYNFFKKFSEFINDQNYVTMEDSKIVKYCEIYDFYKYCLEGINV